ncbi:MAG: lipid A biosynthesis acyltransferase [Legionellaceae bacterium]|nr:lipid A biosynthesis acyltransferase [Legionellaceae bacterium]HCA89546.1 lipid A biosynthesis acyltransferase [Legionellales bacterium]|tara:strand:+ start:1711 stop:2565 length:855 start_codon:yes stop_codon:yes gene_type:complete
MNCIKKAIIALPITMAGRLAYGLLWYRRSLIRANMTQVFGKQLDKAQQNHLIKAFYSHLMTSIREAIMLRFMSEAQLKAQVEVRGEEYLADLALQHQGVLILTAHVGNWEYAPIGGMLNFKNYQGKFHFIRRTLGHKWLEKILFKRYYAAGLAVIPKKNSLQHVSDVLDKREAVVFVLDQHASIGNRDGIAVEFFGKKAGTYRSLATLSRNTGIPVVPAAGYRLPNGKHVLEFYPPIAWRDYATQKEALYQNTKAYNEALERIILAHPEQWMWLHKRWKLKSPK